MNVVMLFAVVYLAFASGGATAHDAIISLLIVGVWIVIGVVWVVANPKMRGTKLLDKGTTQKEQVAVPA